MARPIQNTPPLEGEDAKRFRKNLLNFLIKKLTPEEKDAKKKEMEEMDKNYNLLASISGGTFY